MSDFGVYKPPGCNICNTGVAYLRLPHPISWWNKVLKQGYNYHGGTTPGLWISHMQEETLVRQVPISWWNKVLKLIIMVEQAVLQGYKYTHKSQGCRKRHPDCLPGSDFPACDHNIPNCWGDIPSSTPFPHLHHSVHMWSSLATSPTSSIPNLRTDALCFSGCYRHLLSGFPAYRQRAKNYMRETLCSVCS